MKTTQRFKLNKTLVFFVIGILATMYITPIPAQTKVINVIKTKTQTSYKPLEHYWSNSRTDNFSTATLKGKSDALAAKYRHVRSDGYILNKPSNAEGQAVPLYLYYSHTRKDNFTASTSKGIRDAVAAGYKKVRIEGYVLKTVNPKYRHLYKPLWLYYSNSRKDNFTIATPKGIKDAEAAGYRKIRIEGYVRQLPDSPNTGELAPIDDFNDFVLTNPPNSTQEEIDEWNRVVNKMQGIKGFDPVRNFLNYPPAEKTFGNTNSLINNWFPIDSKKHVCCGKLKKFQMYDGGGDEMDWNIFIDPNDEFSFLIADVLKYKDPEWATEAWNGEWSPGGWHINKETGGYLLEGELTPDQTLYDNVFFPKRGKQKKHGSGDTTTTPDLGSFIGKEICLYGPWVREKVHNNRPEIHPSEMIWWKENKGYYMMLLQDDSNRFDDRGDFDLGGGLLPSNWKPWAEPPLTAQFKIAFKVNPSESGLPQVMDIREVYNRFVVTKDDVNASKDSDNGTSHALVINNKKLLVVNEQQKNDDDLGVKFVDISVRADGTIQGYLQITTKVGGPDLAGDEGYHILYVQKK